MADGWLVDAERSVIKAYPEAVSDAVQYVRCVVLFGDVMRAKWGGKGGGAGLV